MKRKTKSILALFLVFTLLFWTVGAVSAMPSISNIFDNDNILDNIFNHDFTLNIIPHSLLDPPTVQFNGEHLSLDVDPQIDNGTTLVPLRGIIEALGADIEWDDTSKTVTVVKGDDTIELTIGQKTAYKNGDAVDLNVACKLVNGRTMVPLRFISEAIGADVNWDGETRDISITFNSSVDDYIADLKDTLKDYFKDAGNVYFGDDGIDTAINLWGNKNDLVYTVKLDLSNAEDYDNLTDLTETNIESFLNAIKDKINTEINGTDYEDADITGTLVDNDHFYYFVIYNGDSYKYSWNNRTVVNNIENTLEDSFKDVGDEYFNDEGIEVQISLNEDDEDLVYTVKLDFDDAKDYDKLTDLTKTNIESFLNAFENKIKTEIVGTDFEDADISGKLVDDDHSTYYVKSTGSSYTYSW